MPDTIHRYQCKRNSDLRYHVELFILYHRKRGAFLNVLVKLGKGGSVIFALGGSAVALWTTTNPAIDVWTVVVVWVLWLQAMAVILCGAMLLSEHARMHKQLTRAYYALLTAMMAAGQYAFENVDRLDRWKAQLDDIDANEPAALPSLMVLCENQIKIARGQLDKTVPVRGWLRLMAYFYGFPRDAIGDAANHSKSR